MHEDGFHNMTEAEYRSLPYANQSSLHTICKGMLPVHYRAKQEGLDTDTKAKENGRFVHQAILQPETLDNIQPLPEYIKARRGQEWKLLQEMQPDITFLPKGEWQKFVEKKAYAHRIQEKIAANPEACKLLENARYEQVVIWTDPDTGVKCKGMIDILANDFSYLADIKTTTKEIKYSALRAGYYYGYHIQVAMYTDAVCTIQNLDFDNPPKFLYIFIENFLSNEVYVENGHEAYDEWEEQSDPYGYLKFGRDQYKKALKIVAECQEKDDWYSYPHNPTGMIIPRMAKIEGL